MTELGSKMLLSVESLSIGALRPAFRTLVKDVHFSLNEGEILGIVGQSGSGKTLTAFALGCLLPPSVEVFKGQATFRGRGIDFTSKSTPGFNRGKDLLLLFQSPLGALNPSVSVGRQISEALRAGSRRRRSAADRHAKELMERVGLSGDYFKYYPFQLSGGQLQRVLLAIAFGLRPHLLIADEPTAGQDDNNRDQIIDLLIRLRQEENVASIIISHDLRIVSRLADKLVVLYQGEQVEAGRAENVFKSPVHPHTRDLLAAKKYMEKSS